MQLLRAGFILYVRDQGRAAALYRHVFGEEPILDVPGMTEFRIQDSVVLGLMPESGISRLLGPSIQPFGTGTSRAEVYLVVDDPESYLRRLVEAGGSELSPCAARDWGDDVAYGLDFDGHVLAFARPSPAP